jgi:hypothetical protein
MPSNGASSILRRVVLPLGDLQPAAADALLRVKFNRRDQKRINDLSALAQRGALSHAQAEELDFYLDLGNLLMLLHSKARMALGRRATLSRTKRARRKSA